MLSLFLKITIGVFFLYILFIKNVFYIDTVNSCYLTIVPGVELNNAKIVRGIDVLKKTSFEDYKKMCNYIDRIDPNVDCGGFEGGCFHTGSPKTISVSISSEGLEWVSGVLVHETCHAKQFVEKRGADETECNKEADRIMKKIVLY